MRPDLDPAQRGIQPDFVPKKTGADGGDSLLTRRQFLQVAGLTAGGLALDAACGSLFRQRPTPDLPPPGVTKLPPDTIPNVPPTPKPEIPTNFQGKIINANYLTEEGAKIKAVLENNQTELTPQATAVPLTSSDQSKPSLSLPEKIDYAALRWGKKELKLANSDSSDSSPLVDVIKYAVSEAVYEDIKGGVNYHLQSVNGNEPALAGLSFYRERLDFSNRTDLQGEYVVKAGYPIELNLKQGSGITVVGKSEVDGNIVIAFEEYLPRGRVEDFHEPRIRFAVLTPEEFGNLSKNLLLNLKYYTDTPNKITYTDISSGQDREVEMNLITSEVMQEISKEIEGHWREKYTDPESPTGDTLFPNPIVPLIPDELLSELGLPKETLLYQWWENPDLKGNPEAVKLYARDPKTREVIAVAKYNDSRKEWEWGEVNFRDVDDFFGKYTGTSPFDSQPYSDPKYKNSTAENFTIVYPGAFIQKTADKYSWSLADEFRESTLKHGQILYIHPGFWHWDVPDYIKSVSNEEVKAYMEKRVRTLLKYVRKTTDGARPTFINFLNEALWYDNNTGYTQWENSPFYRVFGENLISEAYLMFYRAAMEMDLEIGRDYRLIYNDYDIYKPGGKTDLVYSKLSAAKRKIANTLGVSESEVLIDVGIQCHFDYSANRPFYTRVPPTKEDMLTVFEQLNRIGRLHLTEFEVLGHTNPIEVYKQVFLTVFESDICDSVTLWKGLQIGALFGPNYRHTEGYRLIIRDLLTLAQSRNLLR